MVKQKITCVGMGNAFACLKFLRLTEGGLIQASDNVRCALLDFSVFDPLALVISDPKESKYATSDQNRSFCLYCFNSQKKIKNQN